VRDERDAVLERHAGDGEIKVLLQSATPTKLRLERCESPRGRGVERRRTEGADEALDQSNARRRAAPRSPDPGSGCRAARAPRACRRHARRGSRPPRRCWCRARTSQDRRLLGSPASPRLREQTHEILGRLPLPRPDLPEHIRRGLAWLHPHLDPKPSELRLCWMIWVTPELLDHFVQARQNGRAHRLHPLRAVTRLTRLSRNALTCARAATEHLDVHATATREAFGPLDAASPAFPGKATVGFQWK